jgi:hypothetical protein
MKTCKIVTLAALLWGATTIGGCSNEVPNPEYNPPGGGDAAIADGEQAGEDLPGFVFPDAEHSPADAGLVPDAALDAAPDVPQDAGPGPDAAPDAAPDVPQDAGPGPDAAPDAAPDVPFDAGPVPDAAPDAAPITDYCGPNGDPVVLRFWKRDNVNQRARISINSDGVQVDGHFFVLNQGENRALEFELYSCNVNIWVEGFDVRVVSENHPLHIYSEGQWYPNWSADDDPAFIEAGDVFNFPQGQILRYNISTPFPHEE